jgi:predicted O-methyltransferase YrrM
MKRRAVLSAIALSVQNGAAAQDQQKRGPAAGRRGGGRTSALAGKYPPLAKDEGEKRILAVLDEMDTKGKTYLSVPASDGRWLRVLTESGNAKHVVEVGTSTGYSGLWFSLALRNTGGKLTTFELDPGRAETAKGHFRQAGVDNLITVVVGDAHTNVRAFKEMVDVVFIDADKEGYVDYLQQLLPRVRPGGLMLAHNVGMSAPYVEAVASNPQLETVFYMEGGELGVSLKKR